MAAVEQHRGRGKARKNRNKCLFCFFGGCFGISSKLSADQSGGKLVKYGRGGKTVGVLHSTSSKTINSSREIHVLGAEEERIPRLAPPAREVFNDETHDLILAKSKTWNGSAQIEGLMKQVHKQNSIAQEGWSKPSKLSHSASLPPPQPAAGGGGDETGKEGKELIAAGEFDAMVGALIVMITLIAMLIWGKVCAILCTAAWFYFIPGFRASMAESYEVKSKDGGNHMDVDSWESKKRVVLQGLLERNHQL